MDAAHLGQNQELLEPTAHIVRSVPSAVHILPTHNADGVNNSKLPCPRKEKCRKQTIFQCSRLESDELKKIQNSCILGLKN